METTTKKIKIDKEAEETDNTLALNTEWAGWC